MGGGGGLPAVGELQGEQAEARNFLTRPPSPPRREMLVPLAESRPWFGGGYLILRPPLVFFGCGRLVVVVASTPAQAPAGGEREVGVRIHPWL